MPVVVLTGRLPEVKGRLEGERVLVRQRSKTFYGTYSGSIKFHTFLFLETERRGQEVNTPYSGGPGFKYRPGDRLS
jgi:hypothetical protein